MGLTSPMRRSWERGGSEVMKLFALCEGSQFAKRRKDSMCKIRDHDFL